MKYFNNFSKSQALGMCLMKASIDTFSSFPVAFQKGLKDVFKAARVPGHSPAHSQAWGKADLSGGSKNQQKLLAVWLEGALPRQLGLLNRLMSPSLA